jgi:hypothetical protein
MLQMLKIAYAFVSLSSAGYALIRLKETPPWLTFVVLVAASIGAILAANELPSAFNSIRLMVGDIVRGQ